MRLNFIGDYRRMPVGRREEKVDFERLAQLESGSGDRIRVPLPNRKVNEMFAIATRFWVDGD